MVSAIESILFKQNETYLKPIWEDTLRWRLYDTCDLIYIWSVALIGLSLVFPPCPNSLLMITINWICTFCLMLVRISSLNQYHPISRSFNLSECMYYFNHVRGPSSAQPSVWGALSASSSLRFFFPLRSWNALGLEDSPMCSRRQHHTASGRKNPQVQLLPHNPNHPAVLTTSDTQYFFPAGVCVGGTLVE
jgi:hypothetical protein